MSPIITNTK